jgi:hypothetical protein
VNDFVNETLRNGRDRMTCGVTAWTGDYSQPAHLRPSCRCETETG